MFLTLFTFSILVANSHSPLPLFLFANLLPLLCSAKASSGINGAYTRYQASSNLPDSPSNFHADSLKSSNRTADSFTGGLIERMVGESGDAVEWIIDRANVAKPILVGQMGGHSSKRTHRPER